MTKRERETEQSAVDASEQPDPQAAPEVAPGPRKPYRAPSVQKRRSLLHATLVSGGGTGGTLAGSGL